MKLEVVVVAEVSEREPHHHEISEHHHERDSTAEDRTVPGGMTLEGNNHLTLGLSLYLTVLHKNTQHLRRSHA